jgi:hypothetical protein
MTHPLARETRRYKRRSSAALSGADHEIENNSGLDPVQHNFSKKMIAQQKS